MGQAKVVSREDAIQALNRLFVGRSLSYFCFGTYFRLHFGHYAVAPGSRPPPPFEVIVDVLGDFWINDKADWEGKVADVPSSVVEPSEPIMAYELARLRWTQDSDVIDVSGDDEKIVFTLKNRETINFSMFGGDEFAFLATDDADETKGELSICCDQGVLYARGLDLLDDGG